jgi:hypothetical protein
MIFTRPTIVYVSGPITTGGNVPVNVRLGIEAAVKIMDRGYVVICPHEKAFGMEMLSPRSYEAWMKYDYRCIDASDVVYRMADEHGVTMPSAGGDREVAYAQEIGKPVYWSYDTLFAVPTIIESMSLRGIPPPVVCYTCGRLNIGDHSRCRGSA